MGQEQGERHDGHQGGLFVVDAQVHAWLPESPERPWPEGARRYLRSTSVLSSAARPALTGHELLAEMDRAGVRSAILVPPVFAGDDNAAALEQARLHEDRFRVMGRIPFDEPAGRAELDRWDGDAAVVGGRLTFFWPEHRDALDRGDVDWLWAEAERRGVALAVLAPGRLTAIDDVARRHPDLRLIIDHFGMDLERKDAAALEVIPDLLGLAARPNVAVKASTLPSYVTEPYPFPSLYEPIRRVLDAFGSRRVFWGSELTRLPVPYEQAVGHFTTTLDFLAGEDLEWVMGRGIRDWLGWT